MNPVAPANLVTSVTSAAPSLYTAPAKASTRAAAQSVIFKVFAVDLILITISLLSAFYLRFHSPLNEIGFVELRYELQIYLGHIIVGITSLIFILVNSGFYAQDAVLSHRRVWSILLRCASAWLLVYLAASLILKFQPPISRVYSVLAYILVVTMVGTWRTVLLRTAGSTKALSSLRKRILLVGWNQTSHNLYGLVKSDSRHLNEVVGVIPAPGALGYEEAPPSHIQKVGRYQDLHAIFRNHDVDTVVVADLRIAGAELVELSQICEKDMVDFKLIPSGFQILLSGLHLEHVSGVPVLGISRLPLQSLMNVFLKRLVDICGALFGMIISLPFLAAFGFMIYRESPGSIFYRQRRLGRDGQHFTIFKLRSMRLDSETTGGAQWARQDDPRCLRVGAFMRKWNIDELPQFWNVLKGEMSLVGPRPERPELIMQFKDSIPHYNARHHIKPGMTGWAQVNGLRGNTDLTERVQYDLFYIENWSLVLDFQIMLSTMFKRENAY